MSSLFFPQSSRFQQLLQDEESYRAHDFPLELARKVMRYGAPVGSVVEYHFRLDRCMFRLREMIVSAENRGCSLSGGAVVMAEELTAGSGRFARLWHAPSGGVWMAMAWADCLLPEFIRLLPIAAGTACCETLLSYGIAAEIKWVNDIQVEGSKIAGILTETVTGDQVGAETYHLVGLGINCNNTQFPKALNTSAVSMSQVLNRSVDIKEVFERLLVKLTWNFGLIHYEEEVALNGMGGIKHDTPEGSPVLNAWRKVSNTVGRRVLYGYDVVKQPLYEAVVEQVDDRGGLVMRLDDGSIISEYSGEIIYIR